MRSAWRREGNSKMRLVSMAATAVIAAAALTTPAEAGDVDYLGLRGSLVQTDDGGSNSASIDYSQTYDDTGFAGGVFMGWVIDPNFRLEVSADYRSNDLDSVHIIRNDFDGSTEGNTYGAGGHARAGALLANIFYDIHFLGDLGVLPWIGAGIGVAYIDYAVDEPTVVLSADDGTWALAYQLMAGVTVPLADNLSGSIAYRYFGTEDFTYVDTFGLGFETDLVQQSIDVGLQFHL
jgi:OOP family OmpA-OmpF porin